jgi:V/A-type H+-transporting ATPase subunit D
MPDVRDVVPTRSALLELRQERGFVRDGHDFLDQKRLLLAGEALRCLAELEQVRRELEPAGARARTALVAALGRHGPEELGKHPVAPHEFKVDLSERRFLGLYLPRAELSLRVGQLPEPANPSPEAARCAKRFRELTLISSRLAALATALERLFDEYRRTGRRVRALENVILPELDRTVQHLEDQLDSQDREETLRARFAPGVVDRGG